MTSLLIKTKRPVRHGGMSNRQTQRQVEDLLNKGQTFKVSATDGFTLKAGAEKISIIQEPACADPQIVNLSPFEARQLAQLLPVLARVAERRKAAP